MINFESNNMNLKDFIKETIIEISTAITECNKELSENGTIVNPRDVLGENKKWLNVYGYLSEGERRLRAIQLVNFDVAVTATDRSGKKGGIGIAVASLGIGAQGKTEEENVSYSRLTFSIPVALPNEK